MLTVTLNTTNSRWIEYLSMNAFIRAERDCGKLLIFMLVVKLKGLMGNYYVLLYTFALFHLYTKVGTGGTTYHNAYVAFILSHDCYIFPRKENQMKNLEEEIPGEQEE